MAQKNITLLEDYLRNKEELVYNKMVTELDKRSAKSVCSLMLKNSFIKNSDRFYNTITLDKDRSEKNFFQTFKSKYSLQFISNKYLSYLARNKGDIENLIETGKHVDLFEKYFANALATKDTRKELASFYSKLLHTYCPEDYPALDNPIKKYLGLKKEGFVVSIGIIRNAYARYSSEKSSKISEIRDILKQKASEALRVDELSDQKILDMVFWTIANSEKKIKKKKSNG